MLTLPVRSESDTQQVAEMFLQSCRGGGLDPSVFRLQHAESNEEVVRNVQTALSSLAPRHEAEAGLRSLVVADLVVSREQGVPRPSIDEEDRSIEGVKKPRLDSKDSEVLDDCCPTGERQFSCPIADIDEQVRTVYSALVPGSILLVVTQGDLSTLKQVASQKLRYFKTVMICQSICGRKLIFIDTSGIVGNTPRSKRS